MGPRSLCVILTLWMVSSRPSTSILPGTPVFRAWWGTPESREIARHADAARRTGDLDAAESYYQEGYEDAVRRKDEWAMVGYLNGVAACRLTELRYTKALESLLEARDHAKRIGDLESLGAIAVNLSSLYLQVYDFDNAQKELEDGLGALGMLKRPYFLASLLVQLGVVHDVKHDPEATSFYRQAIVVARSSGDKHSEALGLDLLSVALLEQGRQEEAERAILEGIHLREKFLPKELDFSWWRMGAVKLAEHRLDEAIRYTNLALKARSRAPEYQLIDQRGEIRKALGDEDDALEDFRKAVELSSGWRMEVLPASSSLTAADEWLEDQVFSSFIESAAKKALRTGNLRLAEEAFEAVELNRAASLRRSLELSEAWNKRVDPQYWETLAKLRQAEVQRLQSKLPGEEANRLRMELAEMEAKAGLGFQAKNPEIFRDQSSLIHFRRGLGSREVLLSFHLGKSASYLWIVTREMLTLQRLASRDEIAKQVAGLREAVRSEDSDRQVAVEWGERLYQTLFGQIGQEAAAKETWLLSMEGSLFDAPFAALVTGRKDGKVDYLVSKHSVQTIPGALLLSNRPDAGTGWFLGVGDPIYAADPRWGDQKNKESRKPANFLNLFQTLKAGAPEPEQFGRLIASAAELKASAASWGGDQPAVLLAGAGARRDAFLEQLRNAPGVVHLATHVLYNGGTQSFVAFGLGPNGSSEFLTTTDVASLRVPGAFVAMTGCDTGRGDAHPGAGLVGLTRAWEMAGASTVLATSWQVGDSSGDLLAGFYRYLREVPAAEALRRSQLEMIRSGTWRSNPSYWAAYQITGGAR